MKVYVDLGSHNKPFMFAGGDVAERYPTLLHVYHKKIMPDLKPAILEITIRDKK